MAAPLYGKPPFATDDPDSLFQNQPKPTPRLRLKPTDETAPGGARESAYNTFDAYYDEKDTRASLGNIGRGLMNADSDSDDSSDEEEDKAVPVKHAPVAASSPADKHRILFEAAVGKPTSSPSHEVASDSSPMFPPGVPALNIANPNANRSGAAGPQTNQPEHLVTSPHQSIQSLGGPPPPAALRTGINSVAAPAPRQPQPAFMQQPFVSASPSPSPAYAVSLPGIPSPHAPLSLPPPQTPIVPVFARPKGDSAVKFGEKVDILRGNGEETFLPRGKGGKADDFWRRFSMVAKEDSKPDSKSAWLKKTQNGSTRLATWVWIVGILLLILIGGAAGVGWYFTHNKPASQPLAVGGSADETAGTSNGSGLTSVKPTLTAALLPSSTFNPNKRFFSEVSFPTHVPLVHRKSFINRMHQ